MTEAAPNSEQTVEALLAERQRYDTWLAALEQRRATTPSHIYDRVHADYAARLQRVVEELAGQRAALQKMEHTLMDRLATLEVEEAQHRDEAAEAELRAAVGELTKEQYDEVVRRTEAALAAIDAARESAVPELARIRAVLQRGNDTKREAAKPTKTPPGPAAPVAAPAEDRDEPVGLDELTFLKSLVESGADDGERDDDPVRGGGERTAVTAHAARAGGESAAARGETTPPEASAPVRKGSVDVQHDDAPTLKAVQSDQVKSLKCQECGTLNYPTEWYCERCGAELAAL